MIDSNLKSTPERYVISIIYIPKEVCYWIFDYQILLILGQARINYWAFASSSCPEKAGSSTCFLMQQQANITFM